MSDTRAWLGECGACHQTFRLADALGPIPRHASPENQSVPCSGSGSIPIPRSGG
jgi:hypothetical protein